MAQRSKQQHPVRKLLRPSPKSAPARGKTPAQPRRSLSRRVAAWTGKAVVAWLVVTIGLALLFRFVPPPATPLMLLRYVTADADARKLDYRWTPLKSISPQLALAVIAAEDQRFAVHYGFDPEQIRQALARREAGDGHLRGASTISQQTAKNVFLWPSRTWVRKGFETYFTTLIEAVWSKERILEVYLNVAEMGPGIYGAEAASRHWYGKSALDLTREEAAGLAVILPNPRRWSPQAANGYTAQRRAWVLRQMENLGGAAHLKRLESANGGK